MLNEGPVTAVVDLPDRTIVFGAAWHVTVKPSMMRLQICPDCRHPIAIHRLYNGDRCPVVVFPSREDPRPS